MRTRLASESRRTCSSFGHESKPATQVRVVRGKAPGLRNATYVAFYPECSECAAREFPKKLGTTERVRRI